MSQPTSSLIFTVSRLNTVVRQLLEMEMGQIWLSAEISNFSQPASGHWYFSLKDANSQVSCAMFRNSHRRVTFRPQNGQQVLVRASVTLYEPRGNYQLIVESMQPAGDGALQQQFEKLKQTLSAEGLFDQIHKQALPAPTRQPGVITSATGAALHDILNILKRRDPGLPVVIYPVLVQGNDAPESLVKAIELANQRKECDVLIVGRGGGSLEDLWAFNDERVARAIFASQIPIVSAVGHETDVTIADFVADLRAPTPSAAAELISRNQQELARQLFAQQQRLEMAMDYWLARQRHRFSQLYHQLQQQHPQLRLARQQTRLFKLRRRLDDAIQGLLRQRDARYERLMQRFISQQPQQRVHQAQSRLQQQQHRLFQAISQQLHRHQQHFISLSAQLEAVSPLATLTRGFSVTTTPEGKMVKRSAQIKSGDRLRTRLHDGWVDSVVTDILPDKPLTD